MPTYDYVCEHCEHEFEEFQLITAKPLRKCPECKKLKLRRLIGAGAGVIFKGSGFYETDYRSDGYKKSAEAEKKAAEPKKDSKNSKDSKGKKFDSGKSESKKADTPKTTEKKSGSGGGSAKSK